MHITRRAPELSATSSSVDIWIMASTFRPRTADALERFPGLQLGNRPALADTDNVADLELPALVVSMVVLGPANGLLHDGMGEAALHVHHHRLRILVAHHDTLEHALRHSVLPYSLSRPSAAARSVQS